MAVLRVVLVVLFILALPIWLITSNLRIAVSRTVLFEYGFRKNNTVFTTGISEAELLRVAKRFVSYFNSAEEPMNLDVTVDGGERQLFNQKEVAHLKDVKSIIQLFYRVQAMALAYMLGYFAVSFALKCQARIPGVGSLLVVSSAATIGLLALAGAGVFVGFDTLFLQFHLLSFSNNLWQLDPSTDYLIRLFPREFFFDASLFIAGATMAEAGVIGVAAQVWRTFAKRRAVTVDHA